jgi:hypothetical protein
LYVDEINAALVAGHPSMGSIGQLHGIRTGSLVRHKRNHLPDTLIAQETAIARATGAAPTVIAGVVVSNGGIHDELQSLRANAERLGQLAEAGKDFKTALLAIRELRQLVESQERIMSDRRGQAADIAQSPSWKRLQSRLVLALNGVPGAIEAMQTAIREHVREG